MKNGNMVIYCIGKMHFKN